MDTVDGHLKTLLMLYHALNYLRYFIVLSYYFMLVIILIPDPYQDV